MENIGEGGKVLLKNIKTDMYICFEDSGKVIAKVTVYIPVQLFR